MRLPDGARSRALLIGTTSYRHLKRVEAARNNVEAMREALARDAGITGGDCLALTDPDSLAEVGAAVERAAKEAEDLLLVYYSGHGLVDDEGMLHLTMTGTSDALLPWSGIPFRLLNKAVQYSRAAMKVVILDTCYSGIAIEPLLGDDLTGQLRIKGNFTLTSSPANSPSYAFEGLRHTAFTELLLDVLKEGVADAGELLTLNDIYKELLRRTHARGLPEPQKCGTHIAAESLALAPNRHEGPPREVPAAMPEPPVRQAVPAPAPSTEAVVTADEVRSVKFTAVQLAEGYDQDEVDAFLDRVVLALVEPPTGPQRLTADDVRSSMFTSTRLREGYEVKEVDAFLDRIEAEFERRQAVAARRP
ncbi:caspase, EACC1-associated type [Glycomyces artemisiae]|uniref:Cell wall synthesis protein Wag31 n=2 Tax=Glycomyces artemisiae TaxID=1076443 RepID=A0A2T0UAT1_9ACTN|nr:DivIVA domain-containing protein [Glycomyces artemisiae]PRY54978.1 DivIVA domain-containing protein [Glycomyces artemisiae]